MRLPDVECSLLVAVRRHNLQWSRRLPRTLAVLFLALQAAAMPLAGLTCAMSMDTAQSSHQGHDGMSHPVTAGDEAGLPCGGCCENGSLDCQCGCLIHSPPPLSNEATVRDCVDAPAPAAVGVSRHVSGPAATPFRPPA